MYYTTYIIICQAHYCYQNSLFVLLTLNLKIIARYSFKASLAVLRLKHILIYHSNYCCILQAILCYPQDFKFIFIFFISKVILSYFVRRKKTAYTKQTVLNTISVFVPISIKWFHRPLDYL